MNLKKLRNKIELKLNSPKDSLELLSKSSRRDHFMYQVLFKKKVVGIFQVSMGSKEPGKRLTGLMARQLGISSQDLQGIESCSFWGTDFVRSSRLLKIV